MTVTTQRLKKIKKGFLRHYGSYLFLLPSILGFFIFTLYPVLASLIYSFTDFNGLYYTEVGFQNYVKIFDSSVSGLWSDVGNSLIVTFIYSLLSVPFGMILSFMLSLLVYENIKGIKTIRLLYYLPCLIPGIASSMIFLDMFSVNGVINYFFSLCGLPKSMFFESEDTAMATLIFMGLWSPGGGMIMWLAAFRNVDTALIESAKIDGAGYWRRVASITIPMSMPIIFYNFVTALIASIQVFNTYAMVGTGPNNSLNFICINIYNKAFGSGTAQMGLASAMSWVVFIIIAILTLLSFKVNNILYYDAKD